MKFRFLGDSDCPDWLLAEINTISRMPFTGLTKVMSNCMSRIGSCRELDINAIQNKIHTDKDELSAIFAALEFIFISAIRNEVNASNLKDELSQLGLPLNHANAVANQYGCISKCKEFNLKTFRISQLVTAEAIQPTEKSPVAKITLKMKTLNNDVENVTIDLVKNDIPILLEELKKARSLMENLKETKETEVESNEIL